MPITSGSMLLVGRFMFADAAQAQGALDAWVAAQPAQNAYDTRDDREQLFYRLSAMQLDLERTRPA